LSPEKISNGWQALVIVVIVLLPVLTLVAQAWTAAMMQGVHSALNGGGLQRAADQAAVLASERAAKIAEELREELKARTVRLDRIEAALAMIAAQGSAPVVVAAPAAGARPADEYVAGGGLFIG